MTTSHSSRDRSIAYRSLGITPNDVLLAPKITPLLARICGGDPSLAITYIRASSELPCRKFILIYDDPRLPRACRRSLPLEAFCVAAGLDPTELLDPIARAIHRHGAMEGAVLAATRHPAVVSASLDVAVTPDGVADRMANLRHMGYLPSPKGSSVNVNVNANATAAAASKVDAAALAAPEDTIRRMVEARQRAALGAAAPKELPPPAATLDQAFLPRRDREPRMVEGEYEEAEE
jgi:hypothetical protein